MLDQTIQAAKTELQAAIKHFESELAALQTGRANAALVTDLSVEAYGSFQPLKNIASVSVPDAQTIQIQPWDKGALASIEKAIQNSSLGLNPVNDGIVVRINIPPTTEERRKDLVKVVGKKAEECRIGIRHARQKAHDIIRKMKEEKKVSEDEFFTYEGYLQKDVDEFNKKVEEIAKKKEQEILKV